MTAIIVGAIIVELPEIFRKSKKLNKLYRGYFVNVGIVITLAAGILAPLSSQPRIDETLRIIFVAIGALFTALGVCPSNPLVQAKDAENLVSFSFK